MASITVLNLRPILHSSVVVVVVVVDVAVGGGGGGGGSGGGGGGGVCFDIRFLFVFLSLSLFYIVPFGLFVVISMAEVSAATLTTVHNGYNDYEIDEYCPRPISLSTHLFACTARAKSFAYIAMLALLVRSAALIRSLACSLTC